MDQQTLDGLEVRRDQGIDAIVHLKNENGITGHVIRVWHCMYACVDGKKEDITN